MRTYIKLYGPPIQESIKALEKVAVESPEVCMMHQTFVEGMPAHIARDIGMEPVRGSRINGPRYNPAGLVEYFRTSGVYVTEERCESIISNSGRALGDYDFFYEWFEKPSMTQVTDLIKKIDAALAGLGCRYTATTKK